MLKHTFVHIPGIGDKTERLLWEHGILGLEDFVPPYPEMLQPGKARLIEAHKKKNGTPWHDPHQFAPLLKTAHHWRLFPVLRERAAYLDIETTGLGRDESIITTIALYDGASIRTYVYGENLEDFRNDIDHYDLIVTFNGKCFDLPMLQRHLGINFRQIHIDLRFVLRNLGICGGLKRCEKQLGIGRGMLDGLDGYGAVLLWQEYVNTGDRRALETLLAYNVEDTVNLEALMVHAYNRHLEETPFAMDHTLSRNMPPPNPYEADAALVERICRQQNGWRW